MVTFEYEGRDWNFSSPGPAFALEVRRLTDASGDQVYETVYGHLIDWMDIDDWVWFVQHTDELPEDAVAELFMRWLEAATSKPMSAVTALSNVAVRSWPLIQGKLILAGHADPMNDLPTLSALLNTVDALLRESHQSEKDTAKYEREVYKPRQKTGTISKPAGFESADMAEQDKLLASLAD